MARYGDWRPLAGNWDAQPGMRAYDLVLLHTMVGSLAGTDSFFRKDGYGGVESHFGVGGDGSCWQWQDTSRRAEANLDANDNAISIETEDKDGYHRFPKWDGEDVPAWTDDQVNRLADLVAWCCRTHNIPCELVPDSRPGRRGVGYHRLGIDPWRVSGGEKWSTSTGKVCPGGRRVSQVPGVIAKARDILGYRPDQPPASGADGLPQLDPGDHGPAVTHLQAFFKRYVPSYAGALEVDGAYGPHTEAVVREYQKRVGLPVVGRVGPRTNGALWQVGYRG